MTLSTTFGLWIYMGVASIVYTPGPGEEPFSSIFLYISLFGTFTSAFVSLRTPLTMLGYVNSWVRISYKSVVPPLATPAIMTLGYDSHVMGSSEGKRADLIIELSSDCARACPAASPDLLPLDRRLTPLTPIRMLATTPEVACEVIFSLFVFSSIIFSRIIRTRTTVHSRPSDIADIEPRCSNDCFTPPSISYTCLHL